MLNSIVPWLGLFNEEEKRDKKVREHIDPALMSVVFIICKYVWDF